MQDFQNITEQIDSLYLEFVNEHEKNIKGNKSAGTRARKAIGEIKKLVTDYRKLSVDFNKNK